MDMVAHMQLEVEGLKFVKSLFEAIVRSNWWDDATVALQFLSHLEGDALNVTRSQKGPRGPD